MSLASNVKSIILSAAALAMLCSFPGMKMIDSLPVHAEEDYSDTEGWYNRCTQVQTSDEGVNACKGFQEYQNQRKNALRDSISSFNDSIASLGSEASATEALAAQQRQLADELQAQIAQKQNAIAAIQESIAQTEADIVRKQQEIEAWDAQIKSRMKAEQAATGTNQLIDLIMGSSSLPDLLRRITGIERITASDQNQISELNRMKEELQRSIEEMQRLQNQLEEEKNALQEQEEEARALEASYQRLVEQYQQQIAEMEAQMRNAQADLDSIKDFVITVEMSNNIDYGSIPAAVGGFINPVPSAYTSAGTWAYPSGGLHLGLDRAAPVGSPLVAPADGLVIFASNSSPSTGGYLGNWTGHPAGSGNTIEMLCQVDGTLYAISFFHLSNSFNVGAGSTVSQGQVLAQTGHSGNSTGPHTHIEVYNLGGMSMQDAVARFAATGDTAFGTGWGSASRACEATGTTPCRERPEKFFP